MCGGVFDVLVQPLRVGERALAQDVGQDGPIAMAARVPSAGSEPTAGAIAIWKESLEESDGALGRALEQIVPSSVLEFAVQRVAAMIGSGRTGRLRLGPPTSGHESIDLFIETRTVPAHLVIFGANAFGQALVEAARPLGHRITLCDPRPAFTDPASFPSAEVVREWPHRFLAEASEAGELDARTMICVLTHDPKVDVPALVAALDLDPRRDARCPKWTQPGRPAQPREHFAPSECALTQRGSLSERGPTVPVPVS